MTIGMDEAEQIGTPRTCQIGQTMALVCEDLMRAAADLQAKQEYEKQKLTQVLREWADLAGMPPGQLRYDHQTGTISLDSDTDAKTSKEN